MAKHKLYAVAIGKDPSTKETVYRKIYNTWDECKLFVIGVPEAKYKGFDDEADANEWCDKILNSTVPVIPAVPVPIITKDNCECKFDKLCESLGLMPDVVTYHLQQQFIVTQSLITTANQSLDKPPWN